MAIWNGLLQSFAIQSSPFRADVNYRRRTVHSVVPASIVVVGRVLSDTLGVEPLGKFQTTQLSRRKQHQMQQRKARRRLPAPLWHGDFNTATERMEKLQAT